MPERKSIEKVDACPKETLCAGPSRPTSDKKSEVRFKRTREDVTECWAVSPHQSEGPRKQQVNLHGREFTVKCQSGEFYYAYKWD